MNKIDNNYTNEVDNNYTYFKNMLPKWEQNNKSKFALIHNQELDNFFESENDALMVGADKYGFGNYSVQAIDEKFIDLGHMGFVLFPNA